MFTNSESESSFGNRNLIIIILLILLFLTFLGINLLTTTDNVLKTLYNLFGPFFFKVLAFLGLSTGNIIHTVEHVASDTGKLGLDLAGGAVEDVADLIINTTKESFDSKINNSKIKISEPQSDSTGNPIQNSISCSKNSLLKCSLDYVNIDKDNNLITVNNPGQKMTINPTFTP
jgi:hypothetical protein